MTCRPCRIAGLLSASFCRLGTAASLAAGSNEADRVRWCRGTGGGPIRWRGSSLYRREAQALPEAVHRRQQAGGAGAEGSST